MGVNANGNFNGAGIAKQSNYSILLNATSAIAGSWTESNRDGIPCTYSLIGQDINSNYKTYLMYNLLIKI